MKKLITLAARIFVTLLPWPLRRWCLVKFWGFQIHPQARIGLSWIFPKRLTMGPGARIGHLNVAIHLESITLGTSSTISRGNWITGFPKGAAKHFTHQPDRDPSLVLGDHAAVTKDHHLDCTHRIEIGPFSTIAGYASQFLTHSIDVHECRQDSAPIVIGDHCFIGTNVVVLGGSVLPDRSVLGAKALLSKAYDMTDHLYGGVPAKPVGPLQGERKYFTRQVGFVN